MGGLNWPVETARPAARDMTRFVQPGSNICLDFHGDPARAKLVVFSDGNHHMALHEALQVFIRTCPEVEDVFYSTTPPGVALKLLYSGHLDLGNLRISVTPNVFIGPQAVLDQLAEKGFVQSHYAFARSRGIALLVRKGNPKKITGVESLARPDVRLFISNPDREQVSYEIYADCLRQWALRQGHSPGFLDRLPGHAGTGSIIYGEAIHHREAPQAIADGHADAAVVFRHLALRYQRVFPDLFEYVLPPDVCGSACGTGSVHCGIIGGGGEWGASLIEFLLGEETGAIYSKHGLEPVKTILPPAP